MRLYGALFREDNRRHATILIHTPVEAAGLTSVAGAAFLPHYDPGRVLVAVDADIDDFWVLPLVAPFLPELATRAGPVVALRVVMVRGRARVLIVGSPGCDRPPYRYGQEWARMAIPSSGGKLAETVVPFPGSLCISSLPSCRFTSSLAIANPSPNPGCNLA